MRKIKNIQKNTLNKSETDYPIQSRAYSFCLTQASPIRRDASHMLSPTSVYTTQTHTTWVLPWRGWIEFKPTWIRALLGLFLHTHQFSISSGDECHSVCWAGASGGSHDHSRGSEVHDSYVWQSSGSPGVGCFGLCLIHQWFICHNMVRRAGFVLAVCVSRVITWWIMLLCWWILFSIMLELDFLLGLTHFMEPLSAVALISCSYRS